MAHTIRRKRWDGDNMRDRRRNPDSDGVKVQRRAFRAGERQRLREAARDGGDALTDHYARPWRVDRYSLPTW